MHSLPDQLFTEAYQKLEQAVQILNSGGNTDLTEVEKTAHKLCDTLSALPPQEAKKYENKLHRLIFNLTTVRDDLVATKAKLESEITSINHRNTAYNAYGNAMFLALQAARDED